MIASSILMEPSKASPTATGSATTSGMASMITPPSGVPEQPPKTSFNQIAFKWALNYQFVLANDGGNQIFFLLPRAISFALNITEAEVVMHGLKPYDSSEFNGYIATIARFYIPADMTTVLQAQLRNPLDPLWHNPDPLVNDLTALIDNSFPLEVGKDLGSSNAPPAATETARYKDGDAISGDISASRKVNPTSVGVVAGAIVGALAYGAAMFFIARRYRNRKMAHKRTNSVPSTGRYTYGSMNGGAAFMTAAARGLGGRSTPGGRDSRGSGTSSNGRSIRTAQISAPVMAENSLGWN